MVEAGPALGHLLAHEWVPVGICGKSEWVLWILQWSLPLPCVDPLQLAPAALPRTAPAAPLSVAMGHAYTHTRTLIDSFPPA